MLSLSQIITTLESLQTGSSQLSNGSFYFGDPWEFGASNRIQYPFVGCRLISSNINGKIFTTSLNLFFCDLVHKDESNESQVLSDMTRAAYRYYSELREELEDNYTATLNITSSITPFTERFDDEVSGVEMNINIDQFFDRSTCT